MGTEEAKEEEEKEEGEAAGDIDPFAMMGGMGEEEVYKVTLDIAEKPNDQKEEAKEEVEEEEAADGEMDDPFAMMGGMGTEEVYKVTLMEEETDVATDADQEKAEMEKLQFE